MKSLKGKVVAITGAGSGIGRALAQVCAQHGARLALSDINEAGLRETLAMLPAGTESTMTRVDVGMQADVEAWANATRAHFGSINVVINNAGVALSGTVGSLSIADYEWVMRINFWGVVYGTKAFLPHLEASGDGHVVNISSVFGLTAQPLMSGYNASKFAVRGFTESLRQDLELAGSCVSATCVHPGGIKTNIAKAARVDASVGALTGRNAEEASREFERLFFTTPEGAARTIVSGILANRRRVLIGADARAFDLFARTMPALYQRVFTAAVRFRSQKA